MLLYRPNIKENALSQKVGADDWMFSIQRHPQTAKTKPIEISSQNLEAQISEQFEDHRIQKSQDLEECKISPDQMKQKDHLEEDRLNARIQNVEDDIHSLESEEIGTNSNQSKDDNQGTRKVKETEDSEVDDSKKLGKKDEQCASSFDPIHSACNECHQESLIQDESEIDKDEHNLLNFAQIVPLFDNINGKSQRSEDVCEIPIELSQENTTECVSNGDGHHIKAEMDDMTQSLINETLNTELGIQGNELDSKKPVDLQLSGKNMLKEDMGLEISTGDNNLNITMRDDFNLPKEENICKALVSSESIQEFRDLEVAIPGTSFF